MRTSAIARLTLAAALLACVAPIHVRAQGGPPPVAAETVATDIPGVIAAGMGRSKWSEEDVEVCGLYWHFVDLVWMFIFPLVYLMSVKP